MTGTISDRHWNLYSRGNKFWFWEIFVEVLDEGPSYFIQSKPSASDHEYSESDRENKFVMLLSHTAVKRGVRAPFPPKLSLNKS